MKRLMIAATAAIALTASWVQADSKKDRDASTVEFVGGSVFWFADADASRKLIGTADDWVRAFGPFDRVMRVQSEEPVSEKEFLEFAAGEVREWDDEEMATLTETIAGVEEKLTALGLQLDLPQKIWLVQTTGHEEGDAGGYTRGTAIIVPEKQAKTRAPEKLEGFILHELFHLMTRHDPDIRIPLYEVIGFTHCDEIVYPSELLPRKITNPDAFHFDTYIDLNVEGERALVIPVTLSKSETYTGGGLFTYVTIEFLRLDDKEMKPVYGSGKPVLYKISELQGFMDTVGKNTMYIVHPEEILADNFSMAVRGQRDVPNPEILDAILDILSKDR